MKNTYKDQYVPSVIKWGRFTNLVGTLLAFLPGLVCALVYNLRPDMSTLMAGFALILAAEGVFWFVEPISYYSSLGLAGTYMAFLSGNISNLRVPVALAAQSAADVELGSDKGGVVATIGIAISVVINVVFLTIGVLLGSSILSMVPPTVVQALTNIVPALFGALFAQQFVSSPKYGVIGVVLAGGMIVLGKMGLLGWFPGGADTLPLLVAVFGTMLIGRAIATKKN